MKINITTLTEAQAASGIIELSRGVNTAHLSNAREVPYAEIYRERTAIMESPIERIQRAAEDEHRRLEQSRQ